MKLKEYRVRRLSTSTRKDKIYRSAPQDSDCKIAVEDSCRVVDEETGSLLAVFLSPGPSEVVELTRQACLSVEKWTHANRQSGVISISKVFGFQPRDYIRKQAFCHKASLAKESPGTHGALAHVGRTLGELYREVSPAQFAAHKTRVEADIRPEWRMKNSIFTSGILNKNNPLVYHFDAGNIEGLWSAMVVLRKNVVGGFLNIPDYDLKIMTRDKSILYFNGQMDLHGVTPMSNVSEDSYRYSAVFYSTQALCKCGTLADEISHAQTSRTQTEMRRAGLIK